MRWILQHDAVSTVIPGASRPEQVLSNLDVFNIADLTGQQVSSINQVYQQRIKPLVHHLW